MAATTTTAAAARTATRALLRGSARRSALHNRSRSHHDSHRGYHSHSHPPQPSPFSPTEAALLRAAYAHVPEHGFTSAALGRGARDAGLLDVSPAVLPDGPLSLIRWHLVTQREALAARAEVIFSGAGGEGGGPVAAAGAGVGAKVRALAWERLMGNKDVNHRWQEALAIMAQPSHVPFSVRELALLADEIWHLAGDAAVDASWYAKRASLSAAYAASELFMTADRSAGFAETRRFLGRRVGEVEGLGAAVGSVGQWVGFTFNAGVNVLRSKGVRI